MSLQLKFFPLTFILLYSLQLNAIPPGEVVDACRNNMSMGAGMIIKKMPQPGAHWWDDGGLFCAKDRCYVEIETIGDGIHYGTSECHEDSAVFINGYNLLLEKAINLSINPYIGPGGMISRHAEWLKIVYREHTYLCIVEALSDSGAGAARVQYYVIENVMPFDIPSVYYYLFETDVMPLTMSWPEQQKIIKEFPFFKFSEVEENLS
ncbi:hypothetical protein [Legionella quinlivanii]|nr:hypothetical protein [Legionella quinlivanii]